MNEDELIQRAQKLIRRFDNMRIIGSRGEWSGSSRLGFMFNPQRGGGSSSGGPVVQTGACCLDGGCFQTTQVNCVLQGGTYQGNGTLCSSTTVDCTQETSGACCALDNCSIETPEHCLNIGGVYQGDDTDCDPNPCTTRPDCLCGYVAFDGSGRMFLTKTQAFEQSASSDCSEGCDDGNIASATSSGSRISHIDPDTCDETCISGSGHASGTYCNGDPPCDMDFGCFAFPSDCGGCNSNHIIDIETTATLTRITETWSSDCCSQHKVTSSELSDECNPI